MDIRLALTFNAFDIEELQNTVGLPIFDTNYIIIVAAVRLAVYL